MVTTSHRNHAAQTDQVTSKPSQDETRVALAGLMSSCFSVVASAVIWVWLALQDSVSGATVNGFAILALVGCLAAVVGVIAGIIGRHDVRGVVAIVVGILGGLVAFVTAGFMGLALAFGGMSAGL